MTVKETTIKVDKNAFDQYLPQPEKSVFFDIETTGLHRKYSRLYLIGIIFYDNGIWKLRQWFATKPADEPKILQSFLNFIKDYQYIIHYNGDSFDLPYLESRCSFFQINAALIRELTSIDLYRLIKPFRGILPMDKMTLRDAEQFMQIYRTDPFRGDELIGVYQEYLQTGAPQLLETLLQHNTEDVLNMTRLLPMLSYPLIFETDLSEAQFQQSETAILVSVDLDYPLPRPIEYQYHSCLLTASKRRLTIHIKLFYGELKYFYDNPKDYYYLPAEDRAIHKSIGTYVDKNHRYQANYTNCYQKQDGIFAPQFEAVFSPVMKKAYKEKSLFFLCDKPELLPDHWQRTYAAHILAEISHAILKK